MLASWGLGGDELAGVRVDVVEVVVVVVVVVVGVVCRHLLDAGGDAPHRLHVRLRGRSALCPPPFAPPSSLGSHAPSLLSLGALALALALALGPLSSPMPVSRVPPLVPHALARSLSHPPSSCPLHLGTLPAPLSTLPVPWPLPGPLPVSRVPPLVHHALARCSPTSPRPAPCTWAPCPRPCALFPCPDPSPAPCLSRRPLLPSPPPLRPSWTTRRASRCLCSCGSVTPVGERSRVGGRTCRSRPRGKGWGGYGLGGLVWVWAGLAWARYFALSLPTAAAAAAAGEASAARAGFFPRLRGVPGAAAPRAPSSLSFAAVAAADEAPVAAVANPRTPSSFSSAAAAAAGEAPTARAGSVATPRPPFLLSCAAAAALGDASGSRAGAAPLVGGVPGAAAGAAAWLAAVSASCASGRGGAAGLAAWAAGAAVSAGPGSRAGGGGPTTAASASLRSSRSARVSPVHSGEETGERERDRRWWRSSRWRDPSESAITVTLVGMRGGRRALPTTSWCISAVPWAVPCGALRGGGGEGVGGRLWRQPRTAGGPRPSTGIGRVGGGATRPTRRATAPSLGRGPGPWAPGGRRAVSGAAAPGGPP